MSNFKHSDKQAVKRQYRTLYICSMSIRVSAFLLVTIGFFSCVSKKQYQSLEQQKDSIARVCFNERKEEVRFRDSIINVVRGVELAMETQRLRASALSDSLQICQTQFQENKTYLASLGENLSEKQRKLAEEIELPSPQKLGLHLEFQNLLRVKFFADLVIISVQSTRQI